MYINGTFGHTFKGRFTKGSGMESSSWNSVFGAVAKVAAFTVAIFGFLATLNELGLLDTEFRKLDPFNPPHCEDKDPSFTPIAAQLRDDEARLWNLSLLKEARSSASSLIKDHSTRHEIYYLNDGWYNNCRSWIPDDVPAWAEIDLGDSYRISKITLASEHTMYYHDRTLKSVEIVIATKHPLDDNGQGWVTVAVYKPSDGKPIQGPHVFLFQPVLARYVRIRIPEADEPPRIDEVEIFGERHGLLSRLFDKLRV